MSTSSKQHIQFTQQHIRVLIVDDARLSQHVIQQYLQDAHYQHIHCVDDPNTLRQQIEAFDPQIIILDWMMPEVNGLSLTQMIREQDKINKTHTYVLMVTGKESQDAMLQAFNVGVDDFIGKADVASQLIPRMVRARKCLTEWYDRQQLIARLRQHLEQQKQLITLDPVSQLPTHLGFHTQFAKAIETASARSQGMSCMLIHISNFDLIQSQVQPDAFRKIVQLFVEKLNKYVRPSDYLARTSPHEFSIIFHHDQETDIPSLDRIERGLRQVSLKTKAGFHTLNVRTARATMNMDTFIETWDDQQMRQYLRNIALTEMPLVNRMRQEWPTNEEKTTTLEDIIFTDSF